ncbi:MAG: nucleotide exchange factor GrpE [bacterium]
MEEDLRNVGETAAEEINETAPEDPVKESEETLTAEDAVQEAVKKAYEAAEEEPPETEEEPAEDDKQTADEKEEEAGGLFGRKERKLKKELEQKCEELAEKQNSFLRLMAEFDNFRKRTEKEKSGMYAMGAKDVIEKILPVLDNFERGFSLVTEEDKEDAFVQGMEKIYKQFVTVLEELGVTPIDAEGKEFDPNLHNAVMHIEDENLGENVVAKELQKGYMYKDSVVRHSMVTVAN